MQTRRKPRRPAHVHRAASFPCSPPPPSPSPPGPPTAPVRIVAPFAAGGASDIIARILAEELSPLLGQNVIVENRTGAGGSVGTEFVARARPDGLTLLMASQATHGVNPVVQRLGFDPATDTTPIAALAGVPAVLIVGPTAPVANFAEFLAYVRARPGQLAYGSAGIGASTHMTFALMAFRAGLDITHIPYRGTALVIPDILAGRVLGMTDTINTSLPFIREGRLRALAVSTASRLAVLPDVPAIAEAIPGYEVLNWYGLNGPAGLPAAVVTTVHAAMANAAGAPRLPGAPGQPGHVHAADGHGRLRRLYRAGPRAMGRTGARHRHPRRLTRRGALLRRAAMLRDRRFPVLLMLGFSAGVPLPLTGFVLRQWFAESQT